MNPPHPLPNGHHGFGGFGGMMGGGHAGIFGAIASVFFAVVIFVVVVALLVVVVRFLLVATKAAQLYIANNQAAAPVERPTAASAITAQPTAVLPERPKKKRKK